MAKISGKNTYILHKLGDKVHWLEKCICGCFCVGLILFFLVGPFLMFSDLSYIASENLVTGLTTTFDVTITNLNNSEAYAFNLYKTSNPLNIALFLEDEFYLNKYD